MTVVRLVLAAQQASTFNFLLVDHLDLASRYQIPKSCGITVPVSPSYLEIFEHILRRCEFRQMLIFHSTQGFGKISQVVTLREA